MQVGGEKVALGIPGDGNNFELARTQMQRNFVQMQVGGEKVALGIPGGGNNFEMARTMLPLGRVGTAEEAAGAMLLLACPYASYITAQVGEGAASVRCSLPNPKFINPQHQQQCAQQHCFP